MKNPCVAFGKVDSDQTKIEPGGHNEGGQPVEFFLTQASFSDTTTLKTYLQDLPEDANLIGDKAYNMIERILPKHIHVATADGYEFKVALFVLA